VGSALSVPADECLTILLLAAVRSIMVDGSEQLLVRRPEVVTLTRGARGLQTHNSD